MIIMRTMSDQKTGAYQPNCFNCGNSESMLGNGDLTGPNAMKRKKSSANSEVAGHDELSRDHSESQSFCRMTSSTIQSTALAHFLKEVFGMSKSNGIRVFWLGARDASVNGEGKRPISLRITPAYCGKTS